MQSEDVYARNLVILYKLEISPYKCPSLNINNTCFVIIVRILRGQENAAVESADIFMDESLFMPTYYGGLGAASNRVVEVTKKRVAQLERDPTEKVPTIWIACDYRQQLTHMFVNDVRPILMEMEKGVRSGAVKCRYLKEALRNTINIQKEALKWIGIPSNSDMVCCS